MYLLAATTAEKLQGIPVMTWIKFVGIVLAFIVGVILIKKILELDRLIVMIIGTVIFGVVFVNWVYFRNEPKFLSPIIDRIAVFAPTGKALEPPVLMDGNSPTPIPKKK